MTLILFLDDVSVALRVGTNKLDLKRNMNSTHISLLCGKSEVRMQIEIARLLIKHKVGNDLAVQQQVIDESHQRAVMQWPGDAAVTERTL